MITVVQCQFFQWCLGVRSRHRDGCILRILFMTQSKRRKTNWEHMFSPKRFCRNPSAFLIRGGLLHGGIHWCRSGSFFGLSSTPTLLRSNPRNRRTRLCSYFVQTFIQYGQIVCHNIEKTWCNVVTLSNHWPQTTKPISIFASFWRMTWKKNACTW